MESRFQLVGLALVTALALGQTADQAVIRVGTRLVQFNVIVRDRKGPVEGLKKTDFKIFDRGVERPVALFQVNRRADDDAKFAEVPKPPPGMTSNAQADAANTTVVLFDGLNTALTDQIYAKHQVVKFLKQVKPTDRVGIYVLGSTLRVLHEFTTDTASLMKAVDRFQGDAAGGTGTGASLPDADASTAQGRSTQDFIDRFKEFNKKLDDTVVRNRVLTTVDALKSIARHLERIAGRKNLVWVSSNFPVSMNTVEDFRSPDLSGRDASNFTPEIEQASRALMRANVAVYPVDARGLMTVGGFSASGGTSGRTWDDALHRADLPAVPLGYLEQSSMDVIADRTGGKAFYNTNDIMGSIRRALEDSDLTYTVGFYLPQADMDTRFHEVKIAVDRKGVEVRARKGYLADSDFSAWAADENRRASIMREVWNAPLDATGLTVAFQQGRADAARGVGLTVFVDPRQFVFEFKNGELVDTAEAAVVQQAADGRVLQVDAERYGLHFARERYRRVLGGSFEFHKVIEAKPDAVFVRVVVFDYGSGLVGSSRSTLGWVRAQPPPAPGKN